MPTTAVGTPMAGMDVDGQDHTNGWAFAFDGGPDDALFTITDSDVLAGAAYIPGGDKSVTVRATKVGEDDVILNFTIPVGDKGLEATVIGSIATIPAAKHTNPLTDFSIEFLLRKSASGGAVTGPLVTIGADSLLEIDDKNDGTYDIRAFKTIGNTTAAHAGLVFDKWYLVKLQWNGGFCTVDIDGVEVINEAAVSDFTEAVNPLEFENGTTSLITVSNLITQQSAADVVAAQLSGTVGILTLGAQGAIGTLVRIDA